MPPTKKINKSQISAPSPLIQNSHFIQSRSSDSAIDVVPFTRSTPNLNNGNMDNNQFRRASIQNMNQLSRPQSVRPPSQLPPPQQPIPPAPQGAVSPRVSHQQVSHQQVSHQQVSHQQQQQQQQQTLQQMNHLPAVTPFSSRLDVSASIAGTPLDPRTTPNTNPPPLFTLHKYQSFIQSLSCYRRQIQAMANATETFVRALEDLVDCVPAATISNPSHVSDLHFLIDSTHLIANTHQIWASTLEKDVEDPLVTGLETMIHRVKAQQNINKTRINDLMQQLDTLELESYRARPSRSSRTHTRPLSTLETSLTHRIHLTHQIKSLTTHTHTLFDTTSHGMVDPVLGILGRCVPGVIETYDTVAEGLSKIGSVYRDTDVYGNGQVGQQNNGQSDVYQNNQQPQHNQQSIQLRNGNNNQQSSIENADPNTHQQQQHQQPQRDSQEDMGTHIDMDFIQKTLSNL